MTITTLYTPDSYTPIVGEQIRIAEHWRRGDHKGVDVHEAFVLAVTDTHVTASLLPTTDPMAEEYSFAYTRTEFVISPMKRKKEGI